MHPGCFVIPVQVFRYDRETNQVVICSDKCQDLATVTTILTHELVHMYDNCTAKVDWENIQHLACSEVIFANVQHMPSLVMWL